MNTPSVAIGATEATTGAASNDVSTASVTGATGAVGGTIKNSAPTVLTFASDATTGENRGGFVAVLSGEVKDRNAEQQIATLSVTNTGPAALGATHAVTPAEKNATTEPATFGADGFKVWTATPNDGVLQFRYRQPFAAFTPAGQYAFSARVVDGPGLNGTSSAVSVTLTAFSDITISATPVSVAGAPLPGQNWGAWDAEAGATNVEAANYLKFVNTGDVATSRIVIDLASQFIGSEDSSFAINAANNVAFAWCEDKTPATTAPSECTFSYLPANSESSVTVNFSATGSIIYVKYRIGALPEILPPQAYGISFTVTELA